MRRPRRKVVRLTALVSLVFFAFGVLWPLIFTSESGGVPARDPVIITNYRAEYTVDSNGQLTATEIITARMPAGKNALPRHGIFRYWDITNPNAPRVRQEPQVTSVLLDGKPADVEFGSQAAGRFRVAKIGDPNRYLKPGIHVFEIRYTVPGVLDPGDRGADRRFASSVGDTDAQSPSAFFWNVVAPDWNMPIWEADISVTLPGRVSGVECSVGVGVGRACKVLNINGNQIRLRSRDIDPRTPVTVRAGVDVPTPPQMTLPWPSTWYRILGNSVSGVLWIAGFTAAAALAAYLWCRRTIEPSPGFPLQHAPLAGLGPVQVEYIRTEAVPPTALFATLLYLAERGMIELTQVTDELWRIRGLVDINEWDHVDRVSEKVGIALKVNRPGTEFETRQTAAAGEKLSKANTDMAQAVEKWALDGRLMVVRHEERHVRAANVIAFVLAALCFSGLFGIPITLGGLPFAAFFLVSLPSWNKGVGTRRTAAGRELWSQAGGFHRTLSTNSSEARFDFAARKDLYTAYIPFAVAAGVASLWAEKFANATDADPPQPNWLHSPSSTLAHGFAVGIHSFNSTVSSSINVYTTSLPTSSGGGFGSGGGGGVGGGGGGVGGGGGGGGSW